VKASVLIIEDDSTISELISLYLAKDGVTCAVEEQAEKALETMHGKRFDLIVLDLNLPGMDGFEFLQKLRRTDTVPVIIVSARQTDEDKILGLGLGADDFVSKPFSPRELVARVRSQLRRAGYTSPMAQPIDTVSFGPFNLDFEERRLIRDGEEVPLSRMEFELLVRLVRSPRISIGAEELYTAVWGTKYGDLSTVAVHVRRLRCKIEEHPSSPRWIMTVHGFGYRFDPEGGAR